MTQGAGVGAERTGAAWIGVVRLLRPREWVKNGLAVVPLVFGGRLLDPEAVVSVAIAVVVLCMGASTGYVLNDLRDRDLDRLHPVKRERPLPSGSVRPELAAWLAAGLGLASFVLAYLLGLLFVGILVAYLLISAVYTYRLKQIVILDVLTIGALFVLRVEAGALAADVPASDWLLIATGVLAVFMGLCKRRHELVLLGGEAGQHRGVLGEYSERFLDVAISLTTATALITYLLYAIAPETIAKVGSRGLLAGAPFAFYGLLRYLHLVYSRNRGGHPTELVMTDPGVLTAVAGFALVCGLVIYL